MTKLQQFVIPNSQFVIQRSENGVYIYRVVLSNGIDESGKLVILKQ